MNKNFVSRKKAAEALGVHYHTVYRMAERGEIQTLKIGDRQYYNVNQYLLDNTSNNKKRRICYCRVSSAKQKGDLKRQKKKLMKMYPGYEILEDIGSGLNFKRKGLREIIDCAIKGELEEVVITYKDRLARIGYELIEYIIESYSGGSITILNKGEEETPNEEMTKDVLAIMNIYVAKINGMRKRKK